MSELLLVIFLDGMCILSYSTSNLLFSATNGEYYHVIVQHTTSENSTMLLLPSVFQVTWVSTSVSSASLSICKKSILAINRMKLNNHYLNIGFKILRVITPKSFGLIN